MADPSLPLEFDPLAIAGYRALHAGSRLLRDAVGMEWTRRLEFELRYRRDLAVFGESDSDLVVSTFSKSGTTWMQWILYQLTTDGSLDFDHLFDVSPWVWYATLREVPPARVPAPRILKSHDDYRRFAGGRRGRFVFVLRDGRDVCISLFHHRRNFKRYDGSFEEHFDHFLDNTEYNWFDHLRPWLENRRGLSILYVRYEDLKRDFEGTVRRLAVDCGIAANDDVMARVIERCGFAFMKQHEPKFAPRNEHFAGRTDAPYLVRHADQFIRHGVVGEGAATLTASQLARYRDRFDRTLAGFDLVADYR